MYEKSFLRKENLENKLKDFKSVIWRINILKNKFLKLNRDIYMFLKRNSKVI